MRTEKESAWSELWSSFKYFVESKKGKYSLDSYLDIVGEYTDRVIKEAEKNGLKYVGGECQIINSYDTATYDFGIQMYFEDSEGKRVEKEAKRKLSKKRFVSETDLRVGDKIKFEIDKPD